MKNPLYRDLFRGFNFAISTTIAYISIRALFRDGVSEGLVWLAIFSSLAALYTYRRLRTIDYGYWNALYANYEEVYGGIPAQSQKKCKFAVAILGLLTAEFIAVPGALTVLFFESVLPAMTLTIIVNAFVMCAVVYGTWFYHTNLCPHKYCASYTRTSSIN